MIWLFAALAVAAAVGIVLVATRGGSAGLGAPDRDRPRGVDLAGPLGAEQLRTARFPVVLRGYRMADVDALLAALADRMDDPRPEWTEERAGADRADDDSTGLTE